MIAAFSANELVWRFGWMLLHSLWQIALIGLAMWVVLQLARKRSAHLRYWIACCGLALCFLPLVYTFTQSAQEAEEVGAGTSGLVVFDSENRDHGEIFEQGNVPQGYFYLSEEDPADPAAGGPVAFKVLDEDGESKIAFKQQIQERRNPWMSWLVACWLTGVCLLAIWNLGGWLLVQRIRRRGTPLSSHDLRQRAEALLERMQIGRAVRFLESLLVEIPVTIGWLKPVVLLPAGLLSNLTPDQVEAVLAHELAHIRRHDYFVNLLQTLTESLLFYHPIVWWISRRIRVEREFCCDDEAVVVSGDRNRYVTALAAVETSRTTPAHALSLSGSRDDSTVSRMRRLMGVPRSSNQGWLAGLTMITLLLCLGLAVGFSQNSRQAERPAASDEPVEKTATEARGQHRQNLEQPRQESFPLDSETFRLDLYYYGDQDKPYYQFSLGRNVEATKQHGFHLVEPTEHWEKADYEKIFQWLRRSGYFQAAQQIDLEQPPVPASRAYLLRVSSGEKVWEEDLGFQLGMLLRLKSLQRVLAGLDLKSGQNPDAPIGLELLLSRISGLEAFWREGQLVDDLKLQVISEQNRFVSGTAVPVKIQLQNTGAKPRSYAQHILSLVPGSIYIFDEHGRRVPYVGGTSQIQSHEETLGPGETVVLDQFDLAQFNYLRRAGQHGKNQPGRYFMYAVHGNGIRSNGFQFEITRNFEPEPDFVGRLLPLVHDDWILVANPNFRGKIHPGRNFSKVAGFPVRFQCSPTGSIRDVSHVWIYFTKERAQPVENSVEFEGEPSRTYVGQDSGTYIYSGFDPETSYLGQIGKHHLYAYVDEKSQQRWPDVLDQIRKALRRHTDEEQFLEVMKDFRQIIQDQNELRETQERETEQRRPEPKPQQNDPISFLIRKLEESHGLWMNGVYPEIKLPETATARDVLAEAVKLCTFDRGKIEEYRVISARQGISIGGDPDRKYKAVSLESNQGAKILLMHYEPGLGIWWTRFYDTPTVPSSFLKWGKHDQGVQIALSARELDRTDEETRHLGEWEKMFDVPRLELHVRNVSQQQVSFIPHIGSCRLEWDGTWHDWGSPVAWGGPATVVPAGKTIDGPWTFVKLSHDDPRGWITGRDRQPLELTPGEHTIRVELHCTEGQKLVSQPLELTITNATRSE